MKTEILKIDNNKIDENKIKKVAKVLKAGGLVAFPTETVYGLGANGLNEKAVSKIFKVKGRPSDNPMILHVAEIEQVYDLALEVPQIAKDCMEVFWPGPLTIIFKRKKHIPNIITAGLETVAIRMPSHKIAHEIIKESGIPIAAPSANISGKPSPTSGKHVIKDLNGAVEIIVEGGKTDVGIESTVLDITVDPPTILRPGGVTFEDIKELVPNVVMDKGLTDMKESETPKSPGQKYKHYAPKAEAYLFAGNLSNIVKEINKRIKDNPTKKIAVLATEETYEDYKGAYLLINLGSRENLDEVATNLFDALLECDEREVDLIFAEGFDFRGMGAGIMNRLLKACSGRIVFGL